MLLRACPGETRGCRGLEVLQVLLNFEVLIQAIESKLAGGIPIAEFFKATPVEPTEPISTGNASPFIDNKRRLPQEENIGNATKKRKISPTRNSTASMLERMKQVTKRIGQAKGKLQRFGLDLATEPEIIPQTKPEPERMPETKPQFLAKRSTTLEDFFKQLL